MRIAFLALLASTLLVVLALAPGVAPMSDIQALNLECPLPNIGQNLTTAYVFYYRNGAPMKDDSLELSVTFNQTEVQRVGVVESNERSGRHAFLFETLQVGPYRLFAQTSDGSLKSQTCQFNLFGKEPTKVPELSEWAVLLVALSVFYFLRLKKP